jgi:endonuclease III
MPRAHALSLNRIVATLRKHYGKPKAPQITDPFELILFENVAYLGSNERREIAFAALRSRIGTAPNDIMRATDKELLAVTKLAGIMAEANVRKLRRCAEIAMWLNGGDLSSIVHGPPGEAMKALKRFPGIGEPGAERILLFSRGLLVLPLDSNGLRVLTRLGFAAEKKDYAQTYRSTQAALKGQLPKTRAGLIEAHQLLRQHGRELCKLTSPRCEQCPVSSSCAYYRTRKSRGRATPHGKPSLSPQ